MEVKELIQIFRKYHKTFWLTVATFLLIGIAFQLLRPVSFKADLSLNITRLGKQETAEYKYDDFYRLQADERFADPVVRWLGSLTVIEYIKNKSGISKLQKIKAQRLSSQYIRVTYGVKKVADAKKISQAIIDVLSEETDGLNKIQQQENWFTLIGSDPIVMKDEFPISKVILFSILSGIFFGFWLVLIKYYLKDK
jgi:uncharacterized protein involved in exopolysaccharide biosynthesis